jgi:hypothetical protein
MDTPIKEGRRTPTLRSTVPQSKSLAIPSTPGAQTGGEGHPSQSPIFAPDFSALAEGWMCDQSQQSAPGKMTAAECL